MVVCVSRNLEEVFGVIVPRALQLPLPSCNPDVGRVGDRPVKMLTAPLGCVSRIRGGAEDFVERERPQSVLFGLMELRRV